MKAAPVKAESGPILIGGSEQQQEYIDYMWQISHDKNFIYLAKAENGLISPDRINPKKYWCKKSWGYDHGFFGISDCYHPEITSDKRFLSDWHWQIDKSYELYKGGVKFYGKRQIWAMKKFFKFDP